MLLGAGSSYQITQQRIRDLAPAPARCGVFLADRKPAHQLTAFSCLKTKHLPAAVGSVLARRQSGTCLTFREMGSLSVFVLIFPKKWFARYLPRALRMKRLTWYSSTSVTSEITFCLWLGLLPCVTDFPQETGSRNSSGIWYYENTWNLVWYHSLLSFTLLYLVQNFRNETRPRLSIYDKSSPGCIDDDFT